MDISYYKGREKGGSGEGRERREDRSRNMIREEKYGLGREERGKIRGSERATAKGMRAV